MSATLPEQIGADVRDKVATLMRGQGLGVLATTDADGHPYASLIAFAGNAGNTRLYFVTPKATRKYANLTHDHRVALLVNNSANQPADFHAAMAATILGTARELQAESRDRALPLYLKKHPYLQQFAKSPSCALFTIEITGVTMVQKFQSVSELTLDHELDTHR